MGCGGGGGAAVFFHDEGVSEGGEVEEEEVEEVEEEEVGFAASALLARESGGATDAPRWPRRRAPKTKLRSIGRICACLVPLSEAGSRIESEPVGRERRGNRRRDNQVKRGDE